MQRCVCKVVDWPPLVSLQSTRLALMYSYPSLLPSASVPAGISRKRLSFDRTVSQKVERLSLSW